MIRGWEQGTKITAVELARRVADAGVERIIYTDVARDGMLTGPNIEQTRAVAQAGGVLPSGSMESVRLFYIGEDGVQRVRSINLTDVNTMRVIEIGLKYRF